jgi:choline dehydrogenase-like flavoprotein
MSGVSEQQPDGIVLREWRDPRERPATSYRIGAAEGPVDRAAASAPEPVEAARLWDVVIVGTGMGGATLGDALARAGHSVLLLEKGQRSPTPDANVGHAAEARLAAGWWPHPLSERRADGANRRFHAAVGCAAGGSSVHYAAALGRLERTDFDALTTRHGRQPAWPVPFDEFTAYYDAAERAYGLPAAADERAVDRLSPWDRALMDAMRANGLAPRMLRVAMRYDEDCQECIGRICPRACKADARVACLEGALRQADCRLLEDCDVLSIDADASRVRSLHALHRGRPVEIRGRIVVLAAGAMHTPPLLLRSANAHWPNGLANHSDQVGRNLMFHTADIYALFAPRKIDRQGRQKKSIDVRDFYVHEGQRLGTVQSMGMDAGRGVVAGYLKEQLRRRGVTHPRLASLLAKVPSHAIAAWLGDASIFAAITEDDPNPANRIVLDPTEPNGARFSYVIDDDLRQRADALRAVFEKHVRPWRLVRVTPSLSMNHGHPCGSCRFGDDPRTHVLDRDCRAHGVENLYVADASFMPRSGAANPSLTIAANALRIAGRISAQLQGQGSGEAARSAPA